MGIGKGRMHMALITRRDALKVFGAGSAAVAGLGLVGCSGSSDDSGSSASGDGVSSVDVTTAYGPVTGIEDGGVYTWYGIPYGKEPTGDLRWAEPQAPDAWTDSLDCTEAGDVPIQLSSGEIVGTEDVLRLDVVSKEGHSGKPVLVFVHGGNNQTGNRGEIPGTELVDTLDCVYVSLDFRMGILGFCSLPAIAPEGSTGNFGMLDIAYALDWVKDNIAAFGGDPENITISGFSAGGRDVMAMLISPTFEGKFQKAVVYSGGMTTSDSALAAYRTAAAVAPLAVEDGMADDEDAAQEWLTATDDDTTSAVREWLMGVDSERLAALMPNASIRMGVFPHLFEDDVVLPKGGFDAATYVNDVPVIMLTGSTEFSFFCLFDSFFSDEDNVATYGEEELALAATYANTYGSDMYRIFNAQMSAQAMDAKYESNVYVCQVDYGSADSPMAADLAPYGAFHGIFVPMLSTVNNYSAMLGDVFQKDGYVDMAQKFRAYLKGFLATGDPNNEDVATDWAAWSNDAPESLVLDADESAATVSMADVTTTYGAITAAAQADETISDELKDAVNENVINGRWFSTANDEAIMGNWL